MNDEALRAMAAKLAGSHREVDDSWYSCPKSEGGCANEGEGTSCICGRDEREQSIFTALLFVRDETARAERKGEQ